MIATSQSTARTRADCPEVPRHNGDRSLLQKIQINWLPV